MTRRTPGSSASRPISRSASTWATTSRAISASDATGGHLSAPIVKDFLKAALADKPAMPFRVPPGIKLIRVDVKTGQRATPGNPERDPGGLQARHRAARQRASSAWRRRGAERAPMPSVRCAPGDRRTVLRHRPAARHRARAAPGAHSHRAGCACRRQGRYIPATVVRRADPGQWHCMHHGSRTSMRAEIVDPRRRDQAVGRAAEEASLTSTRRAPALPSSTISPKTPTSGTTRSSASRLMQERTSLEDSLTAIGRIERDVDDQVDA